MTDSQRAPSRSRRASAAAPIEPSRVPNLSPEPELATIPPSVAEFLADIFRDSAQPAPGTGATLDLEHGAAAPTLDSVAPGTLDVARHLTLYAGLIRAVLGDASAKPPGAPMVPEPGQVIPMLRETPEGQRLVRAARELVRPFSMFELAGRPLDDLLARTYRGMRIEERALLLRRVLDLAAGEAGLTIPELTDRELLVLAAESGIPVHVPVP